MKTITGTTLTFPTGKPKDFRRNVAGTERVDMRARETLLRLLTSYLTTATFRLSKLSSFSPCHVLKILLSVVAMKPKDTGKALAEKVLSLNPNCPEIGLGMLAQLQSLAKKFLSQSSGKTLSARPSKAV